MKKFNLLFSTLIIALVCLVVGGATIAPAMQFQAVKLAPASTSLKGTILFDAKGRYTVPSHELTVNATYQFFGYDWYLVYVNGNTATFWMTEPYTSTYFNRVSTSNLDVLENGANIWANGYTNTNWTPDGNQTKTLGQSHLRSFLNNEAKKIIDNQNYAKYKDKVVAGSVNGINQTVTERNITSLVYAKNAEDDFFVQSPSDAIKAQYGLTEDDRLWIPSWTELGDWGIVVKEPATTIDKLVPGKENVYKWTNTTGGSYKVWLRQPAMDYSSHVYMISAEANQMAGESSKCYLHKLRVDQDAGVRPAIHLNIEDIDAEYADHLANPVNATGWWSDDWMKALFMTVCILGTVGLILVIAAVIAKARRAK